MGWSDHLRITHNRLATRGAGAKLTVRHVLGTEGDKKKARKERRKKRKRMKKTIYPLLNVQTLIPKDD